MIYSTPMAVNQESGNISTILDEVLKRKVDACSGLKDKKGGLKILQLPALIKIVISFGFLQ